MNMDVSDGLYQEFLRKYRLWDRSFDEGRLKKVIARLVENAQQWYLSFKEKPAMKNEVYITGWVREELGKDLNQYSLEYINRQNKYRGLHQQVAGAVTNYFSIKGLDDLVLDPQKYDQLFSGEYVGREKRWRNLNLPIAEVEKNFVDLINARIQLVKTVNKLDYIDFQLMSNGATKEDYHRFLENIDQIIERYNNELPAFDDLPDWFYGEFNQPCLLCRLKNFPFESIDQTLDYFANEYTLIKKNREKIGIKLNNGDGAWVKYIKETDGFEICLDGNRNVRHQIMSLIHELSHVVALLNRFSNGTDWMKGGKFEAEKEALLVEKDVLAAISKDLYGARLVDKLMSLQQTIFELEIYEKPNQDLGKLYAKIFNKCFKEGRQEQNDLYLVNRSMIVEPLKNLPHCLAMTAIG